jgi:hypothetical protein
MGTALVASALSRIYYGTGATFADQVLQALAWRPPQWSGAAGPILSAASAAAAEISGALGGAITAGAATPISALFSGTSVFSVIAPDAAGNLTAYVFDGVIHAEHEQATIITLNPVQTGAALSDHAYVVPPRLVVEIAMSDAMQSFMLGQFTDGSPRSVSAYQTLVSIQQQRLPVSVATRLRQYDNMVIADIRAEEESRTRYALKAIVTFQQILTASIEATSSSISYNPANSSLPQVTGQTLIGQVQPLPVPASMIGQNYTPAASTVPGAGNWSSGILQ